MSYNKGFYLFIFILSTTIYCADVIKIESRVITIDNKYFFPIAIWMQNSKNIAYQKSLGINTFILNGDPQNESNITFLDSCEKNSVWGIVNHIESRSTKHKALLGWFIDDEPDVHGIDPIILIKKHKKLKLNFPNLITFLNLGPGFSKNSLLDIEKRLAISKYMKYSVAADLVGFDYYPIYFCEPEKIFLVGDLQKEFSQEIMKHRPSFQWIECVSGTDPFCNNLDRGVNDGIYPEELRNQVWQSIVNGATGIGYYTHYMDYGYSKFYVDKLLEIEIASINKQIMEYEDVILNNDSSIIFYSNFPNDIDMLAKNTEDGIILFTVNTTRKEKEVIISTKNNISQIKVMEEDRRILSNGNSFSDKFHSLQMHIYLIKN